MENYAAIILILSVGLGLFDMLTERWKVLQRQLFHIILIALYVLFVIRYYYGPDISMYVPHYENIPRPSYLLSHPDATTFEFGYNLFCSILRWNGVSYWGMTAIITTLYFGAITLLLRPLPKRQIFALATIIMFDCNLIFHENRQCLAVTCFIFMVLLLQKRKYILALVLGIFTVLMHKSGFLPVTLLLMGTLLYNKRQDSTVYALLTFLLILMVVFPVQRISSSVLQLLPLPTEYIFSIKHHLQLGRQVQVIVVLYLMVLFAINMFLHYGKKTRNTWIAIVVLIGVICVVLLYQYFYLLNRIRSFFVPFIVCYIIHLLGDEERSIVVPYSSLIKQSIMVIILAYYTHSAISLEKGSRLLHVPIYKMSTVFELRHASQKQIRDKQMEMAYKYWTQDFMKGGDNKL